MHFVATDCDLGNAVAIVIQKAGELLGGGGCLPGKGSVFMESFVVTGRGAGGGRQEAAP